MIPGPTEYLYVFVSDNLAWALKFCVDSAKKFVIDIMALISMVIQNNFLTYRLKEKRNDKS